METRPRNRARSGRPAAGPRTVLVAAAAATLAVAAGAGCRSGAERGAEAGGAGEERTVSAAMDHAERMRTAYFAGGCFWGVEHYFEAADGVKEAVSGYMGGTVAEPSYEQVCSGRTGHAEVVAVTYDAAVTSFAALAKLFFEIHDPTQVNRQGPDVGSQYRSVVFVNDEEERATTERLIATLRERGYDVATKVEPAGPFYPAEGYHQDYYERTGKTPYCHTRVERFGD